MQQPSTHPRKGLKVRHPIALSLAVIAFLILVMLFYRGFKAKHKAEQECDSERGVVVQVSGQGYFCIDKNVIKPLAE